VDCDVASAKFSHQRRSPVEHFHVARLPRQLDGGGSVLKEGALGRDEPDTELIAFVGHGLLSVASGQWLVISKDPVEFAITDD
jgi:hypothetical protein